MAERRGTKEPCDEGERRETKGWLKIQHSENKGNGIQSHYFMANRWGGGRDGNSDRLYFLGLQNKLWMVTAPRKDACSLEEKLWPS